MISRDRRRAGLVLLAGLVAVAVAAVIFVQGGGLTKWRTGGEELSVRDATAKYLDQAPQRAPALASEQGVIYAYSPDDYQSYEATGTLEVQAVDAGESSTHVRFSLSASSEQQLSSGRYTDSSGAGFRTATLTAAGQTVTGAEWTGADGGRADCTCGREPKTVGPAGIDISLLFPALPGSVTEVQLTVPGFVPLTVPVSGR
ncbi:hypothetical protein [Kineosporia sp. NBRC 101731]|uniref:hypothetical protein n=1 Tax=Kineosporia sp. NBRC 101731 TaxID=3032199 RepID=UPI0024A0FF3A|nr:hypothetical protein [Kineosporia sp. NBRC 101731]GLY27100.1 hypothetical protein Kisp02_04650 [Kineosporia sp. NBRC 101731]